MANLQQQYEVESKKIDEELYAIKVALHKLREVDSKLYEIKFRFETLTNVFLDGDPRKMRNLKNNVSFLPICKDIETNLFTYVIPYIRPTKERLDSALHRKYLKKDNLNLSIKLLREEISTVLKDSSYLQDYKSFNEALREPAKGLAEFSYDLLINVLEFRALKEKFLMVRFEKTLEFRELPETFLFSFIRTDLITITLFFRKVSSIALGSLNSHKTDSDMNGNSKHKTDINRVVLYNIVYSNLFNQEEDNICFQGKAEPFYINSKGMSGEDVEIQELIQVLRENQTRLNLPCMYPRLGVYQRYSSQIAEKIERMHRIENIGKKTMDELQEETLTEILKNYPEELIEAVDGKCIVCKKKFAMDKKSQRILPPLFIKIDTRKEKLGPVHVSCRQIWDDVKSNDLELVVKIECPDENDYFIPK